MFEIVSQRGEWKYSPYCVLTSNDASSYHVFKLRKKHLQYSRYCVVLGFFNFRKCLDASQRRRDSPGHLLRAPSALLETRGHPNHLNLGPSSVHFILHRHTFRHMWWQTWMQTVVIRQAHAFTRWSATHQLSWYLVHLHLALWESVENTHVLLGESCPPSDVYMEVVHWP